MANAASRTDPTSVRANMDTDGSLGPYSLVAGLYAFSAQYVGGSGNIDLQFSLDSGTTKTDFGADTSVTGSGGGTVFVDDNHAVYITLGSASSADIEVSLTKVG